jgi:hypothetical protein
MQKVAVVFDSNVYRDLFRPTSPLLGTPITSIRQKEEKQGIVAYASVFVAMELLSRLHDPVGPAISSVGTPSRHSMSTAAKVRAPNSGSSLLQNP